MARVRGVYETAIQRGKATIREKDTWQQRLSQMVTYGMVSAFRTVPGEDKLLPLSPRVR